MQSSSPERRWEREGILKSSLTEQAEAKASVDMECIPKVVRIDCTSEEQYQIGQYQIRTILPS